MANEIVVDGPTGGRDEVSDVPTRVGKAAPVFLIGCRRTGSTLFRLMLSSHPDVAFRRHVEIEHAFRLMTPGRPLPSDLSTYFAAIEGDYEFSQSGMQLDRSLLLDLLLQNFWDQAVREDGKYINMGTVHSNFALIPEVWPTARYVYLYRDGRDVARSRLNFDWEGSYWAAIKNWIQAEDDWAGMKTRLDPSSHIEVRYEDLILDTESTLRKVCSFLEIPYTSDLFTYTQTSSYKKPDPALVSQWRIDATEMDIRTAEARAGKYLVARGYELSGLPAIEVDSAMARRLERKDIWKRRFRRVRFQGFSNFILEVVSRRLGLSRLHSGVALSIDKKRQSTIT